MTALNDSAKRIFRVKIIIFSTQFPGARAKKTSRRPCPASNPSPGKENGRPVLANGSAISEGRESVGGDHDAVLAGLLGLVHGLVGALDQLALILVGFAQP